MLTVYHYPACSTCKKALKWLNACGIEYKAVHIVEKPPSKKTLATFLKESGISVRKLFNTSGQLYREGGYKSKLETLSESQALDELAAHGKLIKRPLLVGDGVHLVGFNEADYQAALGA